ncbi:C2H2-type zinc finger family protein [Actinidia rufa]|uniref:C2H2-type zinc finger family protein n=1 Tax=Actinidia rufa TaxID=165716 RepID=A0A7J0EAK4_9ERIC|nr:C2H2-type zinc finger family protein [Actinidia rufa]
MELVIRKQIIKGKRTKRKRSRSSPIPISISMANCSSSGEGGGGYGDNDVNTATATTTTPWYLETTDEDVDAGDSLILLSLGQPRDPNGDDQEKVASKFTSEQYLDRQTIGGGVVVVEERFGWWGIGARHVIEPFLHLVRWEGTRLAIRGLSLRIKKRKRERIVLPLDLGLGLNLSAPKDDRLLGSNEGFSSEQQDQQQQQSPIVLSIALALEDCHSDNVLQIN